MTNYDVYHGTGNAFAVVDTAESVDRTAFGTRLCSALGLDGVLFVGLPSGDATAGTAERGDADGVRATMDLVQPDGSRAAMCGNGARVAARWTGERVGADVVTLETGAGPRRCLVDADGETVTVEMGAPSFDPADVPLARDEPLVEEGLGGLAITAVNTGVPHAVAFVEDVDAVDLDEMAPPIRHHEVFPAGANVTLAGVREGGFDQRTFERGVEGETQACGTGAVAVAAVAARLGRGPERGTVTVSPPGGDLEVTLCEDGTATLRGLTAFVERGETGDD